MFAVEQHARFTRRPPCDVAEPKHDAVTAARQSGGGSHASRIVPPRSFVLAFEAAMKARLIKRFEDEIVLLERELKHELPKEIQRARELGDLRENAEYQAAKERQRFVEARVSMLRARVGQIQLMSLDRIPRDKAGFGSKITVVELGREAVYELVMPEDANPDDGLISIASPIGRALSGKEAGDEVKVPTPAGVRTFEILELITIHDDEES
jgi:transcription elongation factor GreA